MFLAGCFEGCRLLLVGVGLVEWSDAGLSQGFEAHVAAADGPFVVLFGHDRSDESDHRSSGGEDAYAVAAAADLSVQSFLGVVAPDLPPVFFGESGERQEIHCSLIEMNGGVSESGGFELVDNSAVLSPDTVGSGWAKMVRTMVATIWPAALGTLVSRFFM